MKLTAVPAQPPESSWAFVDELRRPRHRKTAWRRREKRSDEASLASGFQLVAGFDDPLGRLTTAYDDLREFFRAADVPENGGYRVETGWEKTGVFEAFRFEATETGCRILAADTEGVRRGIYHLEDELSRSGGPFLKLGGIERSPFVKTRISRCFFGPIKRPPKLRDELMDDVDYYPDNYLARLAYEGVNGLWLTVAFSDLCETPLAPEYGEDRERRLAKLRRTVDQCLRYGIKTYVFAIEPRAWDIDSPVLERHPELGGIRSGDRIMFCPFSETSRRYLRDCLHSLFAAVSGLGGLINISLGERATTCVGFGMDCPSLCPKGKKEEPWEILHETLKAMREGMSSAAPDAELLCWLYVPGNSTGTVKGGFGWIEDIAGHMPEGVVLQYNFESDGVKEQLGKPRHAGDYWLSYVGPSGIFRRCAERAVAAGGRVSAKLQVGCSHEVATAPYVTVPSSLYHKYAEMRKLKVSSVMMCWYFGNHPGIMNKAAGELAFEPFPESEAAFLERLAAVNWPGRAAAAAKAFALFWKGYECYPVNCMTQYYGPMHDGPVWPLFLEPQDTPLAPTWLLKLDHSGDRIGECVNYSHSLDEVVELCRVLSGNWDKGVEILKDILKDFPAQPDRAREVGVAEALGIQFKSSYNIFRFYDFREKLFRCEVATPLETLEAMRAIVREELKLDARLLELVAQDPALGFHPEAEGYKYFPAKIRWRMERLDRLLAEDFFNVEAKIRAGEALFPEYTGKRIAGLSVACPRGEDSVTQENRHLGVLRFGAYQATVANDTRWQAQWKTFHDREAIYFSCVCPKADAAAVFQRFWPDIPFTSVSESFELVLEPRRLWPTEKFVVTPDGRVSYVAVSGRREPGGWSLEAHDAPDSWSFTLRLPLVCFEGMVSFERPVRFNAVHRLDAPQLDVGVFSSWAPPVQAEIARLAYNRESPQELGWLTF